MPCLVKSWSRSYTSLAPSIHIEEEFLIRFSRIPAACYWLPCKLVERTAFGHWTKWEKAHSSNQSNWSSTRLMDCGCKSIAPKSCTLLIALDWIQSRLFRMTFRELDPLRGKPWRSLWGPARSCSKLGYHSCLKFESSSIQTRLVRNLGRWTAFEGLISPLEWKAGILEGKNGPQVSRSCKLEGQYLHSSHPQTWISSSSLKGFWSLKGCSWSC